MVAASSGGSESGRQAKGKNPAWMGSGSAKGPAKATAAGWRPGQKKHDERETQWGAMRVVVSLLAMSLLAAFLYLVLTRLEPTPIVIFHPTAYPLQMPPVAFAEEDAELLARISPKNVRTVPVPLETSAAALESFRDAIRAAARRFHFLRRGPNVLLVHIAAHGMLDEKGNACVVPPKGNPFDRSTWLPLSDLLAAIAAEPGLKHRDKLILLDCQRVSSSWRSGWLENRFVDGVSAAVKQQGDPRLHVISAAGSGELSWAAPELRGSTFGHFVARGLRGEGAPSHRALTLGDLFQFVATEVHRYSSLRRGAPQQPVLFHLDQQYQWPVTGQTAAAKTIPDNVLRTRLCLIDARQSRVPLAELQSSFDPLSELQKAFDGTTAKQQAAAATAESSRSLPEVWELYRKLRAPEPGRLPGYVIDPVAWSSIQQRLSAVGQRLLAGKQYQGAGLQTEIDGLARDLDDAQFWKLDGDSPLLALEERLRAEPLAAEHGSGNLLANYLRAEPDKKAEAIPRQVSRLKLVQDIYQELTRKSADDARGPLAAALELLQRVPRTDPRLVTIEEQFVTLLARGYPQQQPLVPATLAALLTVRQQAELAAHPTDPRAHYAVESLVNAADQARRLAEDQFYLGTAAEQSLSPAAHQVAIEQGNKVGQWLRLRDEIWAELPLLAEWTVTRSQLAGQAADDDRLVKVLTRSIALDDALELALVTRDSGPGDEATWSNCATIAAELAPLWQNLGADLATIYERSTNVEQEYRRPADLRNAEIAMAWPPLGGNFSQFLERYVRTLENRDDISATATLPPGTERPPPAGHALLQELHKALDYEFVGPYAQHRYLTAWDDKPLPDVVYCTGGSNRESTWSQLESLLNRYNQAIANESPAWNAQQRALAATARLRQWDRRVRVAAPWLASFQADLRRPTQPTPARWLQEYDAAHRAAWQAYRVARDYWGSGEAGATAGTPFFAAAIAQCDSVLPQLLRPIRYDLPGGEVVSFAERSNGALAALRAWEPIVFPPTLNVSSGAGGQRRLELEIAPAADPQQLLLPPGTATLSIVPVDNTAAGPASAVTAPVPASFASDGDLTAEAVALPLAGSSPFATTAFLRSGEGDAAPAPVALAARLWFRGHVKERPLPQGERGLQYVEYEITQPRYDAPLVEVRGKDVPRGAFLFVFDCSRSMQGGNFAQAQTELAKTLNQFARDSGDSLNVGLMVYGSLTDASANFYTGDSRRGGQGGLTALGQQQQTANPGFASRHPHPDGDLIVPVALKGGKASAALTALMAMREQNCVGVTPLYYATTKAIETAIRDAGDQTARRVVVISDGVNMPYNTLWDAGTKNYFLGKTGRLVNDDDYANLDRALAANKGLVHVTVQLFAAIGTNFEREQYLALKELDKQHDNFEVLETRGARLFQSIIDSLPKAQIELSPGRMNAEPQPLLFNQPQRVKDWDSPGVLRRELERRQVRLQVPGEKRLLEKPLDLLGGEQVVLDYDGAQARLSFAEDTLTPRATRPAEGPRGADALRLHFEALDPERLGNAIRKFRFRLRDEDRAANLAPRPRYVWLEMRPRGAVGSGADLIYPNLDAVWLDSVNLPRFEAPVERWPDAPSARVQAWFRYTEPLVSPTTTIARDSTGQTLTIDREKWQIMHAPAEEGSPRKVVVRYAPDNPEPGVQKLQERAVWLYPAPSHTRRSYAIDGTEALHEFTYTDPDAAKVQLQVRIVSRSQFQQGAYTTEFEFDTN